MGATRRCCASFARRLRRDARQLTRALGVLAVGLGAAPSGAEAFEAGRAGFVLRVNDLEIPYSVFAVYVLPGERLDLTTDAESLAVTAARGDVRPTSAASWQWQAPREPGITTLTAEGSAGRMTLNLLVMHPVRAVENQRLNGYRLGDYPAEPLNGNSLYLPPDGYIELAEHNASLQVSPHFRLSQFPSKQSGGYPKYLVLREQLLLKLELLLERLNERGVEAETFTIMSGYRTPFYNAAIGNVPYSRHVYGGAADIYVDVAPQDDVMDDLNGDGRFDYRDAQYLYRLADQLFRDSRHEMLRGGLGVYRRNSAHGPFLHIDARQARARWGLLP